MCDSEDPDQGTDFDGLLRTMLGWLGCEVEASVHDAASLGDLAHLSGTLCAPVAESGNDHDERWTFPLGPERRSGIVVDRVSFLEAEVSETHMTAKFGVSGRLSGSGAT